ncbi:MAG: SDR family NAD(P)-dependent oxidoreductase [Bacteroidota bacterium]
MKKYILITGSTDGIGKLAALQLAKEGHYLYLHGRDPKKLETVIREIRKEAHTKTVYGTVADFSALSQVQKMGNYTAMELSHIDVLINNAGVFKSARSHNAAGLDLRFTVNYLAPYLLTNIILPLLKRATRPRVINLSSAAQSPVDLAVLEGRKTLVFNETYAQSKLALTMWSVHLAEKHQELGVIAVNPGSLLNTKMVQDAYGQYWSSASKGSTILYDLAVSDEFEGVSGAYFDNDKGDPRGYLSRAHSDAYDPNKIQDLIHTTDRILKQQGF